MLSLLLIGRFPAVRLRFPIGQLGRIDKRLEGEECLLQIWSHRRFVVVRLAVIEKLALERDRSPGLFDATASPSKCFGIATKGSENQKNRSRRCNGGHQKNICKSGPL